jgi:GNAT superfamily N-acetyltransferase
MLVGTVRNRAHYSWVMRHHGRRLVRTAIAAMLVRPPVLVFFLRTRLGWYCRTALRAGVRMFTRSRPKSPPLRQPAVLAHVAVHDDARGSGAGGALVSAFVDAATSAGCEEAVLVTLAGPAGAGRFYRRLGWTLRDRHDDHDGRLLECYVRRL